MSSYGASNCPFHEDNDWPSCGYCLRALEGTRTRRHPREGYALDLVRGEESLYERDYPILSQHNPRRYETSSTSRRSDYPLSSSEIYGSGSSSRATPLAERADRSRYTDSSRESRYATDSRSTTLPSRYDGSSSSSRYLGESPYSSSRYGTRDNGSSSRDRYASDPYGTYDRVAMPGGSSSLYGGGNSTSRYGGSSSRSTYLSDYYMGSGSSSRYGDRYGGSSSRYDDRYGGSSSRYDDDDLYDDY